MAKEADETVVKQIGNALGGIFRHLMPGIVILLAARLSHPSWFPKSLDYGNSWQLLAMAVIATAIGNVWYVFHRYSIHQILDWLFWLTNEKQGSESYGEWLGRHIDESHKFKHHNRDLFDHINFRSAQVIFMLITCEVAITFSFFVEPNSIFDMHRCVIIGAGIAFWMIGAIQQLMGYDMDAKFVATYKDEKDLFELF